MQTLAGLTIYIYNQRTIFTLDSEDYLEQNPPFANGHQRTMVRYSYFHLKGKGERRGKNWGVLSRVGVISYVH